MSRQKWTNEKLFFRLLNNKSNKSYWDTIKEIRSRPSESVLTKCKKLLNSDIANERIIGIDILAQLGISERPFYKETIELYFTYLDKEKNTQVLSSLLYAIGHNNTCLNKKQVAALISLKNNIHTSIRKGLVFSLLGIEDPHAIETLIDLSNDKIASIRDWATFGLGTQIETNTHKIRQALWNRIKDKNQDTKLEAIVGLAYRNDDKVKEIIKQELLDGEYGSLLFEAIELLNAIEFLPLLKENLIQLNKETNINTDWQNELKNLIANLKSKNNL